MSVFSGYENKKAWENIVVGKTITEVMFSELGVLCGFRLNDGTVIHYDRRKGVYIDVDKITGEPVRYN